MGIRIAERRHHLGAIPRTGRAILILGALVVAAIGAIAGFAIWHNRLSALETHRRSMESMGVVLAEQTSRYAQVIDLILRQVQSHIADLNLTPADFREKLATPGVHTYLADRLANVPQADAIVVADANGLVVNWSRVWPMAVLDISDRDYYRYFRDHDDPGVFIGALSKSRGSGALSLFFARRINGPDGAFRGLVLGVVDIKSLGAFYQTAGNHVRQAVTLLRRDGTMLMRYPDPEQAIGVKLPQGSPWYERVAAGGGSYLTPGTLDGVPALVTVHPLADYPLVVDVVMREADVFAQWRRDAGLIAGFALVVIFIFSGLFWMLAVQFRLQTQQNARLARANSELETGRRQFEAVLSNITQGVGFFDGDQRLVLCNRRYAEIYDLPPEITRPGSSWADIVAYRTEHGSAPAMTPSDIQLWRNQIMTMQPPNGGVVPLQNGRFVAVSHQTMPDGGWVATHEDVTMRQQAEASIAFMAHHDALTKLPNRVLFQERMEQAIAMADRGIRFAVFCLDLDRFKQINDAMGHPVGDGLLVAVADRLQACVRDIDTVARLGGDEFAIVQLDLQQPDDAASLANRIIEVLCQPFDIDGHRVTSGASIGITVAPADGTLYETLMRNADVALYLAKSERRGTARFFEPEMDARIVLRRTLEQDLQNAIARHEFELHYQPLIDLSTETIVGFEALLRWHHPVRGLVSPLDFIPVAEETGLIVPIGEWVLQTACFEAENWPPEMTVAVNISAVQLKKGDLVATAQAALAASGLQPARLELEITESVFLCDSVETLRALHRLREIGIGVALDDFGTGYSSLSYLRSFPFSKIKIDKSFVRDLMTNRESVSIIRAVIGLGQSLGIKTIAEGVETYEQLERLRREGCTEVQGYFFSRPKPASDLPLLIERLQSAGKAASPMKV